MTPVETTTQLGRSLRLRHKWNSQPENDIQVSER